MVVDETGIQNEWDVANEMVERPSTFFCLVMNVGIRENCVDDVKCKDNIGRLYLTNSFVVLTK